MTVKRSPLKRNLSSPLTHVVGSQTDDIETAILDNWIDGILVLTQDGKCLHSNSLARRICDRIAKDYPCIGQVPEEIWHVCQILIKSCRDFPGRPVVESELELRQSYEHFRIRARWLDLGNNADPHILIILENQTHSKQNLAITEVIKYDLSPREADVWELHRVGYTYQEIAAKLHIALNTVKKHMKNTYAKQQLVGMVETSYIEKLAS